MTDNLKDIKKLYINGVAILSISKFEISRSIPSAQVPGMAEGIILNLNGKGPIICKVEGVTLNTAEDIIVKLEGLSNPFSPVDIKVKEYTLEDMVISKYLVQQNENNHYYNVSIEFIQTNSNLSVVTDNG